MTDEQYKEFMKKIYALQGACLFVGLQLKGTCCNCNNGAYNATRQLSKMVSDLERFVFFNCYDKSDKADGE